MAFLRRVRSAQAAERTKKQDNATAVPIDTSALNEYVGYVLRRAQIAFFRDFIQSIDNLRPAEFAALVIINANPGLSQSALAAALGIDRSAGVNMLDNLEGMGLAQRVPTPTDRRSYSIVLSELGKNTLATLNDKVRQQENTLLAQFSGGERDTLIRLLLKICETAR